MSDSDGQHWVGYDDPAELMLRDQGLHEIDRMTVRGEVQILMGCLCDIDCKFNPKGKGTPVLPD